MSSTRDHIIEIASRLFEAQGYHATGINQIVAESGAPKGSLYYYFPGGKEEIAAEAIHRAGRFVVEHIEQDLIVQGDPVKGFRRFIRLVARQVEAVHYRAGGPLTTVALESAASERLNQACQEVYRQILGAFENKLAEAGYSQKRAARLAVLIACALEGGVVLSRTRRSTEPLRQIADEIAEALQAAQDTLFLKRRNRG